MPTQLFKKESDVPEGNWYLVRIGQGNPLFIGLSHNQATVLGSSTCINDGKHVSPVHATLKVIPQQNLVLVTNLSKEYGTFVHSKKIHGPLGQLLKVNDVFSLGCKWPKSKRYYGFNLRYKEIFHVRRRHPSDGPTESEQSGYDSSSTACSESISSILNVSFDESKAMRNLQTRKALSKNLVKYPTEQNNSQIRNLRAETKEEAQLKQFPTMTNEARNTAKRLKSDNKQVDPGQKECTEQMLYRSSFPSQGHEDSSFNQKLVTKDGDDTERILKYQKLVNEAPCVHREKRFQVSRVLNIQDTAFKKPTSTIESVHLKRTGYEGNRLANKTSVHSSKDPKEEFGKQNLKIRLCPDFHKQTSAKTDQITKWPKSGKKNMLRVSLKHKVLKRHGNRIPMPGGGSDIRKLI